MEKPWVMPVPRLTRDSLQCGPTGQTRDACGVDVAVQGLKGCLSWLITRQPKGFEYLSWRALDRFH